MAVSMQSGPLIVQGVGAFVNVGETNETPAPSLFAHGTGILDNRFGPFNGGDVTQIIPFWYGGDDVIVVDQAPATLSATNLVAAAVPVAGTPMTLAAASTGITVVPTGGLAFGKNTFPAGALMIDGNPAFITNGQLAGGPSAYDPRTAITRCVRVVSTGADTGTMSIVGMDFYGNIVHETITMAGAGTVNGKKAIKALISATPAAPLSGSNISIGTTDIYGFQIASDEFQLATIYWASALISAATGYTAAVRTSPATAITGDVRGTYATQSASNGTNKLVAYLKPTAWNMLSTGLFGVTQF